MPNRCRIVCLLPGANGTTEYDATLAVLSLPLASIGDLTDGGAAVRRLAAWISNGDDRHPPLEAARIAESVCRHFGIEPDLADGSVRVPAGAISPAMLAASRDALLESAPRLEPSGDWYDDVQASSLFEGANFVCSMQGDNDPEESWRLTQGGQFLRSIDGRHYVLSWEEARDFLADMLDEDVSDAVFGQPPFGDGAAAARRREMDGVPAAAAPPCQP
jgi:hypothetical protein